MTQTDSTPTPAAPPTLVSFDPANNAMAWQAIGDRVMGGRSEGTLDIPEKGQACFEGTVRLDNGGGFASVKADLPHLVDASAWQGIEFLALGDGRSYKVGLRNHTDRRSVVYQHSFTPETDQWTRIRLPFADFIPTWRGKALSDIELLDVHRLASVSLFVSGRQVGEFRLWLQNWHLF